MTVEEEFTPLLKHVGSGQTLDEDGSARAFAALVSGQIPEVKIAAFLTALAVRNPTVGEIAGAARAMRGAMRRINAPAGAIDLCGTGGDGHGTLNVSTAASFVVAACGVPVAKHGNRNMSSRSGTADVLEALGVRIDLEPDAAEACLGDVGLCFLFAPTYHPAMWHVANVRRQLGFRTVFNLLGPICNPAGVKRQLVGVFSRDWTKPVVRVLEDLGSQNVWAVHGADGLDELTTTDVTYVACFGGKHDVREFGDHVPDFGAGSCISGQLDAHNYGIPRATLADLKGGSPVENASAIQNLLSGERGAFRDIVAFNAAAALVIADKAAGIRDGLDMAASAIDSGSASDVLKRLGIATQKLAA